MERLQREEFRHSESVRVINKIAPNHEYNKSHRNIKFYTQKFFNQSIKLF